MIRTFALNDRSYAVRDLMIGLYTNDWSITRNNRSNALNDGSITRNNQSNTLNDGSITLNNGSITRNNQSN